MTARTSNNLLRRMVAALALTTFAALGLGLAAKPASALTIAEIQKKGELKVGISDVSPPYAMLDDKMQNTGLEVDLAKRIGEALGVDTKLVVVTAANRIACLLTDCADILIYGLTITPERATQVWFSQPYVENSFGIVAAKGTAIKTVADLAGHKVGVIRAAFGDPVLTKAAPEGTTIQRYEDMSGLLQAILSGQVDAIAENSLIPGVLNSMKPGSDYETKFNFTAGYWGIAMRPGQPDLLQWINSYLLVIRTDGTLNGLYEKYLKIPMPKLPNF